MNASVPTAGVRPARAHVGCSGWSYADWRGVVYPPDLPTTQWFADYTRRFDTVELNNTFYRLPTPEAADRWGAQAPPGFVYAVKLGQYGSHRMKLRDATSWLPNHLDRVRRLGPALGPTLVQLPPRWKRNAARLDEFFDAAPADLRWALELREPSWLHDEVFDVLNRHHVALCIHDLLEAHPFVLTTDWTYIRFHGPHARTNPYRGAYGPARLRPWAERLSAELDAGHDIYGYFNNDYGGCAVQDATWLREALATAGGCAG